MSRLLKTVLALGLLTAALSIGAAPAAAGQACWQRLINDWYDGRIDKTYPVKCYRDAIANVPEEGESYTSLPEDLRRALALAIRPRATPPRNNGGAPNQPKGNVSPPQRPKATDIVPAGAPGRATARAERAGAGVKTGTGGPFGEAFAPRTDRADSIPLPLIIMAALALLLMAAGAAGMVSRRVQARRVPVAVTPGPRRDAPPAPQE